jgi:protein required for attachment to host cells
MKEEWILVASREEARIYARSGTGALRLVCDMGNPEGRLRTRDLESDAPGRSTDNRMRARHAYSTQESAKDHSLRTFYREVFDRIERGSFDQEFDTLTLIAEPRLLGILREVMPRGVSETVGREIKKDLAYEDERMILDRLSHL